MIHRSAADLSDGQRRELRRLADGQWHPAARSASDGAVLSTVAAALWRLGLAERRGASRTAKPSNPGFQYRITTPGREVLADAEG